MKKQVALKFTDYAVQGTACLKLWGGGEGTIEMRKYHAKDKRGAIAGINDNGFGVEKLTGAIVEMIPNYEGWLDWDNTISFDWKARS